VRAHTEEWRPAYYLAHTTRILTQDHTTEEWRPAYYLAHTTRILTQDHTTEEWRPAYYLGLESQLERGLYLPSVLSGSSASDSLPSD
jgi:hypothetical protein